MVTPLEEPVPKDAMGRIRAFARDLAFGAVENLWGTTFRISRRYDKYDELIDHDGRILEPLMQKWNNQIPNTGIMITCGYLSLERNEKGFATYYRLLKPAFELLNSVTPSSIFISYKRDESSAFALLLLTRLKVVGLDAFLDMQDIRPGDEWHARLETEVCERENFICLLSQRTLDSLYVRQEITWALDQENRIIPVLHNRFSEKQLCKVCQQYPEIAALQGKNLVEVQGENIEGYNNAILKVLNYFGYTP